MNQQERDELRAKHAPLKFSNGKDACRYCVERSGLSFGVIPYPCEVIQVLDAWEETL